MSKDPYVYDYTNVLKNNKYLQNWIIYNWLISPYTYREKDDRSFWNW